MPREQDSKKFRGEIFAEFRNMVVNENGEDKMARESN